MINECFAIVVVCQDSTGEIFTNQADGDNVKRYIECLIDDALIGGELENKMFTLGFAAAVDAISGGKINFTTPLYDASASMRDVLGCRDAGSAVRTDLSHLYNDRVNNTE